MITERIPCIQFSHNALLVYTHLVHNDESNPKNLKKEANLTRGQFKGEISKKTRKDIRHKLCNYYDSMFAMGAKWRRQRNLHHTILTLTLPTKQEHSDNQIKRDCLMRFIEEAKRKANINFYYWVAEKQKRGAIHFHILCDKFINHTWVRNEWNKQIEKLGYLDAFEAIHNHRNPNSTDIETIKNLSKSSRYVSKYTTKVNQQGGIEGRLHGECDALKDFGNLTIPIHAEWQEVLDEMVTYNVLETYVSDFCTMYTGDIMEVLRQRIPYLHNRITDHRKATATKFYTKQEPIPSKPKIRKAAKKASTETIDSFYGNPTKEKPQQIAIAPRSAPRRKHSYSVDSVLEPHPRAVWRWRYRARSLPPPSFLGLLRSLCLGAALVSTGRANALSVATLAIPRAERVLT